jgi:hypothetical protein
MEAITLNWAGGEDEFLLRLGELEALDDKTRDGVLDFRYRLSLGIQRGSLAYSPVRITETIDCLRLGLIGAGMDRKSAVRKVQKAFEDGDMAELNLAAFTVISHSLSGKEHDTPGEQTAPGEKMAAEAPSPESGSAAFMETPL